MSEDSIPYSTEGMEQIQSGKMNAFITYKAGAE